MGRRVRVVAGVLALAEVVVFVLVATWIGLGPTILLTLVTSALGLQLQHGFNEVPIDVLPWCGLQFLVLLSGNELFQLLLLGSVEGCQNN